MSTYIKNADLEPYFRAVSGRLSALPSEYRKWGGIGSLGSYRNLFTFIQDDQLKESLSRLRMSLDYQYSLFDWLKPHSLFQEHHKFVLINILAQIYEGLLLNGVSCKMSEITKTTIIDRITFGPLIRHSRELNIISKPEQIELNKINELRNMIHTKNWSEQRLVDLNAFDIQKGIDSLNSFIENQGN